MGMDLRPGETRIGEWIANWMPRQTGPEAGDPWRGVILGFEDRPQSGQAYYPEQKMLGGGGTSGDDPKIEVAWALDANGFPGSLEVEWDTTEGRLRQTYLPTGPSSAG
jgi:hypothetical protein